MKTFLLGCFILLSAPLFSQEQDTIPRPSPFDEGYFFIGPDDLLKFKGYVQTDAYFPVGKAPGYSAFVLRRARFAATGYFQEHFRYMLYARFDKGKAALNEAFVESRHLSFLKIRVGQFKVPFSLSNLISDAQQDLIERPVIIDNFAPAYDVGIMLFGKVLYEYLDYAVGTFNGRSLNEEENNNGKDVVARLVVGPFHALENAFLKNIYIGASWSNGRRNNSLENTRYSTTTGIPFFTFQDSLEQKGRMQNRGADIAWKGGSASLTTEYLKADFRHSGTQGDIRNFTASGFYTTLSYLLTGEEKKGSSTLEPLKKLDPSRGHWGAVELVARFEALSLRSNALESGTGTTEFSSITVGGNWYPNDDVKVILNYKHNVFDPELKVDEAIYPFFNTLLIRFQYQF